MVFVLENSLRFGQNPYEVVVHHFERARRMADAAEGQRTVVAGVLVHHLPTSGMLLRLNNIYLSCKT